MKPFILSLLFTAFLLGCNNNDTPTTENPVPPTAPALAANPLPLLPVEILNQLKTTCNYVDYIFYPYDFTFNQSEAGSIQQMVNQIIPERPEDLNCTVPFVKISFYNQPNVITEAQIHFGNNCAYFVFIDEKGNQLYANKLGNWGIGWFNSIIDQQNQRQQNGQ